jgi:stage IV sporulation protein A
MLDEFPLDRIDINLPDWFAALPKDSTIFSEIVNKVTTELPDIKKMCDYTKLNALFAGSTVLEASPSITADAGTGVITLGYAAKNGVFYKVLSEAAGETIDSEKDLLSYMFESGKACRDYAKIKSALESARETGYGIVSPLMDELTLEEPELVKKGAGFGVRLRASAPSLHIVSVDVTAEVCPAIGSEQQGEDLINYLMKEFEEDKAGIWNTAMFGKSLSDLVREDMNSKSVCVPADVRKKLKKTIGRIVNESKGGVLCILL